LSGGGSTIGKEWKQRILADRIAKGAKAAGAKIAGLVYGSAFGAGAIRANESLMKTAGELGKKLVSPSP
jgi:diphthamide synthase subunit DPH2